MENTQSHSHYLLRRYGKINPERVKGYNVVYIPWGRTFTTFEGSGDVKIAIKEGRTTHIHIYVRNLASETQRIHTQGHEETHVLQKVDRLDVLERALEDVGIKSGTLRSLSEEGVAQIGGVCALINSPNREKLLHVPLIVEREYKIWTEWLKKNGNVELRYIPQD